VDRLFAEHGATEKVVEALRRQTSLGEASRSAALALARTRSGREESLERWCWETVRVPGASRTDLVRASNLARLLISIRSPAPRVPTTYALSLYRRHRIPAAVDVFERAGIGCASLHPSLTAVDLAFVAALEAKRERPREEKSAVDRLRKLLPTIETMPEDRRALLVEAKTVLAGSGRKVDWLSVPPIQPDEDRHGTANR